MKIQNITNLPEIFISVGDDFALMQLQERVEEIDTKTNQYSYQYVLIDSENKASEPTAINDTPIKGYEFLGEAWRSVAYVVLQDNELQDKLYQVRARENVDALIISLFNPSLSVFSPAQDKTHRRILSKIVFKAVDDQLAAQLSAYRDKINKKTMAHSSIWQSDHSPSRLMDDYLASEKIESLSLQEKNEWLKAKLLPNLEQSNALLFFIQNELQEIKNQCESEQEYQIILKNMIEGSTTLISENLKLIADDSKNQFVDRMTAIKNSADHIRFNMLNMGGIASIHCFKNDLEITDNIINNFFNTILLFEYKMHGGAINNVKAPSKDQNIRTLNDYLQGEMKYNLNLSPAEEAIFNKLFKWVNNQEYPKTDTDYLLLDDLQKEGFQSRAAQEMYGQASYEKILNQLFTVYRLEKNLEEEVASTYLKNIFTIFHANLNLTLGLSGDTLGRQNCINQLFEAFSHLNRESLHGTILQSPPHFSPQTLDQLFHSVNNVSDLEQLNRLMSWRGQTWLLSNDLPKIINRLIEKANIPLNVKAENVVLTSEQAKLIEEIFSILIFYHTYSNNTLISDLLKYNFKINSDDYLINALNKWPIAINNQIINLLLARGANPDSVDPASGQTPLLMAVQHVEKFANTHFAENSIALLKNMLSFSKLDNDTKSLLNEHPSELIRNAFNLEIQNRKERALQLIKEILETPMKNFPGITEKINDYLLRFSHSYYDDFEHGEPSAKLISEIRLFETNHNLLWALESNASIEIFENLFLEEKVNPLFQNANQQNAIDLILDENDEDRKFQLLNMVFQYLAQENHSNLIYEIIKQPLPEAILKTLVMTNLDQLLDADPDGNTALHLAIIAIDSLRPHTQSGFGFFDTQGEDLTSYQTIQKNIKLLIKIASSNHQQDFIDAVNAKGETALLLAAKYNQFRVARDLILAFADKNKADHTGNTPLELVNGHHPVNQHLVKMLTEFEPSNELKKLIKTPDEKIKADLKNLGKNIEEINKRVFKK